MSETLDTLPKFVLLAKDKESPRVEFSVTEHNANELRAFVRRIPELRGVAGQLGATGADGSQGTRGEPGRRGRRGERGFIPDHDGTEVDGGFLIRFQQPGGGWGDTLEVRQGIPGPIGETGAQGEPGPQGDKGDDGAQGEAGPRGLKGLKGAKGLKGEAGPMGGRGGRAARELWDTIELVGTDLVFSKSTAGPLGPSTTVDLSSLSRGIAGLGVWRYRTETTEPPATGQIRFNNATISSATKVFIHDVNSGGSDVSAFLGALDPGDLIYIQQDNDADNFVVVETGTITDDGTYFDIEIANIVQQGAAFTQNTDVTLVVTVGGGGAATGGNKNISIENYAVGDEFVFFRAATDITITKLSFVVQGSGTATVFVRFGSDRSAPATDVVNAGTVVSSTTTGDEVTSFDNAAVSADDWIIVEITAVTGTPPNREELSLTMEFS